MTKLGVALPWIFGVCFAVIPHSATTRRIDGRCRILTVWPNDDMTKVRLNHTSHDSVSVVRTTFEVYGKRQNLTLSQPKTPEPIVTKFERCSRYKYSATKRHNVFCLFNYLTDSFK